MNEPPYHSEEISPAKHPVWSCASITGRIVQAWRWYLDTPHGCEIAALLVNEIGNSRKTKVSQQRSERVSAEILSDLDKTMIASPRPSKDVELPSISVSRTLDRKTSSSQNLHYQANK